MTSKRSSGGRGVRLSDKQRRASSAKSKDSLRLGKLILLFLLLVGLVALAPVVLFEAGIIHVEWTEDKGNSVQKVKLRTSDPTNATQQEALTIPPPPPEHHASHESKHVEKHDAANKRKTRKHDTGGKEDNEEKKNHRHEEKKDHKHDAVKTNVEANAQGFGWDEKSPDEKTFFEVFWQVYSEGPSMTADKCAAIITENSKEEEGAKSTRRRGVRPDGRCGKKRENPDNASAPAECNGLGWKPCCGKGGKCAWWTGTCCDSDKSLIFSAHHVCPDYSKRPDNKLARLCGRLPLPINPWKKMGLEIPMKYRVSRHWNRDTPLLVVSNFYPLDEDNKWLLEEQKLPIVLCTVGSADDLCGNPFNYGEEAYVYTRFILNNWDHLPQAIAFIHGHDLAWHQLRTTKSCNKPEDKFGKRRFEKPKKGHPGGINKEDSCPIVDVLNGLLKGGHVNEDVYIPLNKKPSGIPNEKDLCPWWDSVVLNSSGGRLCPYHEPGYQSKWPSSECCGQFIAGRNRIRKFPREMWESLWRYASGTKRWPGDTKWKLAGQGNCPGCHRRNPIFESMWGPLLGEPLPIDVLKYP